jgi:hypothetical protein
MFDYILGSILPVMGIVIPPLVAAVLLFPGKGESAPARLLAFAVIVTHLMMLYLYRDTQDQVKRSELRARDYTNAVCGVKSLTEPGELIKK